MSPLCGIVALKSINFFNFFNSFHHHAAKFISSGLSIPTHDKNLKQESLLAF